MPQLLDGRIVFISCPRCKGREIIANKPLEGFYKLATEWVCICGYRWFDDVG